MNMKTKARRRARIKERQSLLVKRDKKSGWLLEQTTIHTYIYKEVVGNTTLGSATMQQDEISQ